MIHKYSRITRNVTKGTYLFQKVLGISVGYVYPWTLVFLKIICWYLNKLRKMELNENNHTCFHNIPLPLFWDCLQFNEQVFKANNEKCISANGISPPGEHNAKRVRSYNPMS